MSHHAPASSACRAACANTLAGEPPLARVAYIVLSRFADAEIPLCGNDIISALGAVAPIVDPAVYRAIGLLAKSGHLERTGETKQKGAPPLKFYRITAKGRQALVTTRQHFEFLTRLVRIP